MNTKTLDLRGLSEGSLQMRINNAIAEYIMGWASKDSSFEECQWEDKYGERHGASEWATSADAVLPLLAPYYWRLYQCEGCFEAAIEGYRPESKRGWLEQPSVSVYAKTFPLACCYALLKAHGYEVLT